MKARNCPNCRATININTDRDYIFCSYCGARIDLIDNKKTTINYNHVSKTIDEVGIRETEADMDVRSQATQAFSE